MTEYKYQKQIERLILNKERHMALLELTSRSTYYFKQGVLNNKEEESKIRSRIEDMLKEIPELKDVNTEEFAVDLVNYLFEHRDK